MSYFLLLIDGSPAEVVEGADGRVFVRCLAHGSNHTSYQHNTGRLWGVVDVPRGEI